MLLWVDMADDSASARGSALCYNEVSFVQQANGMKLLNRLSLKEGDVVLDLGCGTGNLASVVAERVGPGGKVVAVDPDSERIKVAKETHACDNIQFLVRSGEDFPEGQYDIVFANSVLHWIEDKEPVFRRVYENLKLGGCFGFSTQDSSKLTPTKIKVMAKLNEISGHRLPKYCYQTCAEMEELAKSVGFHIAAVDLVPQYNVWPTMDAFLQFMFGVLQGQFDPSSIGRETLSKIEKALTSEDGSIVMEVPRLFGILIKPDAEE